jgi:hypothetical protein
MANVFAVKNGVWSDTTLWSTTALPATVDDVFANNFTVTVDINAQVLSINTTAAAPAVAGGNFRLNHNISLSANVLAGSTTCLTFLSASPNFSTIYGNITGSATTNTARAFSNTSSGIVNIYGNIRGGLGATSDCLGITNDSSGIINVFGRAQSGFNTRNDAVRNSSSGIVNVVGNVIGQSIGSGGATNYGSGLLTIVGNVSALGSDTRGTINNSTGTISITGNVHGGTGNYSPCVINNSTGVVNIVGVVLGGPVNATQAYGVNNISLGIINVFGDVYGGASAGTEGILNTSSGSINVTGNVIGLAGNGLSNSSTGTVNIIGNIRSTGAGIGISTTNGNVNILGNVNAGPSNYGIFIGSGFLSLTGNVVGGTAGSGVYGIHNPDFGYVTVYGNVSGGNGANASGIQNGQGTALYCTAVVYGNVFGGAGSGAPGINQIGRLSYAYIYGNVYGGVGSSSAGAANNTNTTAPSFIYIQGNAYGGLGSSAWGVINAPSGFVYVQGSAVGNGFGLNSTAAGISQAVQGVVGSQNAITIVGGLSCGSRGLWPTTGNVFVRPIATSTCSFFTSALSAGPNIALFTSLSANIVPPVSSVRLGTVYNLGDFRGTCAMPSVSSVLQGIAVDNSIGIVALQPQTIWDYSVLSATDVNSLGGRLKDVATVQSVGQQLTALN